MCSLSPSQGEREPARTATGRRRKLGVIARSGFIWAHIIACSSTSQAAVGRRTEIFRLDHVKKLYSIIGVEQASVSHAERMASLAGGFVSILCVFVVSRWSVDSVTSAVIIASMGSSAVLLFAVPHGPLSQPWPVFGGHLVSALIGVTCVQVFSNEVLAASLAVGLAIGAMYYLRCIHPPGGATALGAVIGGEATHELGYQFVMAPVLLNVAIILLVAVLFNYMFPWRRYPIVFHRSKVKVESDSAQAHRSNISHGDFVYALSQIDSFIDINEHDLVRIYDIATSKSKESTFDTKNLVIGGFYSNGQYGKDWAVRQIVNESLDDDIVFFKTVAGRGRRKSGQATRTEFLRWAKHRVARDEENWKRLGDET